MNLELWNKRTRDSEYIEDSSSIFIENVECTAVTYFSLTRVMFTSTEAMNAAKEITGWDEWDEVTLELRRHDDLVKVGGSYYADWGTNNE